MRLAACLILPLTLLLGGCAGLEPAQPPDLNIPDSHLFGVTRLAFDPKGERIASAGFKGDLAVWSVPEGRAISRHNWHETPVRGLTWADDGRLLSADEAGRLIISDLTVERVLARRETLSGLTSLAYMAQVKLVVAGYENGQVMVFSYPGLEPVKQLNLGPGWLHWPAIMRAVDWRSPPMIGQCAYWTTRSPRSSGWIYLPPPHWNCVSRRMIGSWLPGPGTSCFTGTWQLAGCGFRRPNTGERSPRSTITRMACG